MKKMDVKKVYSLILKKNNPNLARSLGYGKTNKLLVVELKVNPKLIKRRDCTF